MPTGNPPVVTVTPPASPVLPGGAVQFTWTAVDPDTKTLQYAWSGHDDEGNIVSGTGSLAVQDHFVMDTFTLGTTALLIDNAGRKATGTAPLT
jgi:hypothetical protein